MWHAELAMMNRRDEMGGGEYVGTGGGEGRERSRNLQGAEGGKRVRGVG